MTRTTDTERLKWSELRDSDFHNGRNRIAKVFRKIAADEINEDARLLEHHSNNCAITHTLAAVVVALKKRADAIKIKEAKP